MKLIKLVAALLALLLIFTIILQYNSKLVPLYINGQTVFCEISETPEKRSKGLMFREYLPKNQGMIFIYQDEQIRTYHMRDVKFPIDIAFVNGQGIIIDIQQMDLDPTKKYPSKKPAQFALEVNKNWFAENKIKEGDKLEGLDKALSMISK